MHVLVVFDVTPIQQIFLEQEVFQMVQKILLLLLIQTPHQTQKMSFALIYKANIQISKIESYLTIS